MAVSRPRRYPTLFARLVANTHEPENGQSCWIWKGAVGRNGRPRINVWRDGKHCSCSAHRVMLDLFYVLDAEAEASHLCQGGYLCVNPDHLTPETKKQNMARRWGKPLPAGRTWPRRIVSDDDIPWTSDETVSLGGSALLTAPSLTAIFHPCPERFGAMESTT